MTSNLYEHETLTLTKCDCRDSVIPVAPEGHKWKEVRHDNTVTWLASWTENIQNATKYVMLNAASKLKVRKIQEFSLTDLVHADRFREK